MKKRTFFTPAVKDNIRELLVSLCDAKTVDRALAQWEDGGFPRTFVEQACFSMFEQVQRDISNVKGVT